MTLEAYMRVGVAFAAALVICFLAMPIVRSFAYKIGAIDVPADETRMHDYAIPRLGGLAIFLGFIFSVVLFADISKQLQGILLGAVLIVVIGVLDDIMNLKWYIKFAVQIIAALIPVYHGVVVSVISNPNVFSEAQYLNLNWLSVPITVVWIVLITNAVNLIDGLDGLAAGVSGIASVTTLVISLIVADLNVALVMAALAGGCVGFLPYNFNPRKNLKMIMGDTGALFLGYILASVSIMGLFKFFAIISFAVPFLVLGLPLFDVTFSFIRRIAKGQHPMHRDRGHFHHRLIDMGLSQKQAVAILYAISILLGLAAVVITTSGEMRALIIVAAFAAAGSIAFLLVRSRAASGKNADAQTKDAKPGDGEDKSPKDG
ncbi:MAG: undecaprenyl/decaprenyl-phosphate alpha-N-acetylglucosaminyl 1-phosphate transferase [Oscillospiraceae bacterium]|jgi:UDP-GlcNAc:undecaprenyl-phosphate GlcNAc-1-phosphate transferase|nr:undecaprenyl/decaprenyl-phosphate alpha-N-acetylglucosaminyl 1-phosphate transferase [Oscillospiraceae bacterium]